MAVALLALVAATGGVGYAQSQERLDGANLVNRSVSTPTLKIGVIRAQQLATGAVTTKIRSRAVTRGKIAPRAGRSRRAVARRTRARPPGWSWSRASRSRP